jgi:hypothetical protein
MRTHQLFTFLLDLLLALLFALAGHGLAADRWPIARNFSRHLVFSACCAPQTHTGLFFIHPAAAGLALGLFILASVP